MWTTTSKCWWTHPFRILHSFTWFDSSLGLSISYNSVIKVVNYHGIRRWQWWYMESQNIYGKQHEMFCWMFVFRCVYHLVLFIFAIFFFFMLYIVVDVAVVFVLFSIFRVIVSPDRCCDAAHSTWKMYLCNDIMCRLKWPTVKRPTNHFLRDYEWP